MPVTLQPDDVDFYHEHGYVVVRQAVSGEKLAALQRETDRVIAAAAGLETHDAIYDLEDSHRPGLPRVRRLKEPFRHFPLFDAIARDEDLLAPVAQLIGENIRLYGGKLNVKAAAFGAPVEWHQDWAFYPHTNDDVLATGLLLDDCDGDNGPLLVLPGSHRGPTYDHHAKGRFCGAIDPDDPDFAALPLADAVPLTGRAGDMTIHHVRLVHGSALNRSNRQRRLLLHEYAAADAWPLIGAKGEIGEFFFDMMVRGEPGTMPRQVPTPIRLPYPPADHQGSIYENQKGRSARYFETFATDRTPD